VPEGRRKARRKPAIKNPADWGEKKDGTILKQKRSFARHRKGGN